MASKIDSKATIKRAERLNEMYENDEIPPDAMVCQSGMIRFVQDEFNISGGSTAWHVVNAWQHYYDKKLPKNMHSLV